MSWALVTGHPLATAAGRDVLERGGSTVDAAIASSAVLAVVSTHANSLGSDAFMLLRQRGRVTGLNASGTAPGQASLSRFGYSVPRKGAAAAVVPGLVKLWETAHRKHGRYPWPRLFDKATEAAAGHPLSEVLARSLTSRVELLKNDEGCRAVYFTDGTPYQAGSLFRQPALVRTLQSIAHDGAGAFYEGWIATSLSAAIQDKGGALSQQDLRDFRVRDDTPISATYRGCTVHTMPPNSFGLALLMQLRALEALESQALNDDAIRRLTYLINAGTATLNEVIPLLADLDSESATKILRSVSIGERLTNALFGPAVPLKSGLPGGTTGVVVADGAGDGVSLLQSNFQPFGSGFLDPHTGVLLNNRMLCFSPDPAHPNVLGGGKRPAHTLNPVMVSEGEELRFVLATPGGTSQTITGAQVLVNLIDRSLPLDAAIREPRWSVESSGSRVIEADFPLSFEHELNAEGYAVTRRSGSAYFGSMKAIEKRGQSVIARADHRREACAAQS